jgi:hypothetical protein
MESLCIRYCLARQGRQLLRSRQLRVSRHAQSETVVVRMQPISPLVFGVHHVDAPVNTIRNINEYL